MQEVFLALVEFCPIILQRNLSNINTVKFLNVG